jgi:AbrB family looped-hinge helix DNA binding protein
MGVTPMIRIRVSSKGQVVIPIEVRERYNIGTGTELELREGPSYITLHPLPDNPVSAVRGLLRPAGDARSLVRALLRDKQAPPGRGRGGGRGQPAARDLRVTPGRPPTDRTGSPTSPTESQPATPPTLFDSPAKAT